MSTCEPGQAPSHEGTLELFFIATAIKACYGELSVQDRSLSVLRSVLEDAEPDLSKKPRLDEHYSRAAGLQVSATNFNDVYVQLYADLRTKSITQLRSLVREHVERLSTTAASYEFMNVYGTCSFGPPNVSRSSTREPPTCRFTGLQGTHDSHLDVVSVHGILSPLVSVRIQQGRLDLTPCHEHDRLRVAEDSVKLKSRSAMRVPKLPNREVGKTLASLEHNFLLSVRRDLHKLGCAYRTVVLTIELLHLNVLHLLHA